MEFYYTLTIVNKILATEGFSVSKQQASYLMTAKKHKLIENVHYQAEKAGKYNSYTYSDEGVKFLREWALKRLLKNK